MKFLFVPGSCVPFHGKTLDERALGGIETAVIRLAKALDHMGHTVYVLSHLQSPPVTKPLYIPVRSLADVGSVDVLVAVRELLPLFAGVPAKASFFWTGDAHNQLQHLGLGDRRVIQRLSALWAVSNWQADRLAAVSGYPRERAWIVRNGHAAELFEGEEERSHKRLVYSSSPYRGLNILAKIFPVVRNAHPDAELHVFSGFDVYKGTAQIPELEQRFQPLFEKLRSMAGVTVHGNILQRDLARELMRSSVLAYPSAFEETSCITAIEAMAAGCAVVTSRLGALPETAGDAGLYVPGEPSSKAFLEDYARTIINVLSDRNAWLELHRRSLKRAGTYTWSLIAEQLTERLQSHFAGADQADASHSLPCE